MRSCAKAPSTKITYPSSRRATALPSNASDSVVSSRRSPRSGFGRRVEFEGRLKLNLACTLKWLRPEFRLFLEIALYRGLVAESS